MVIRILVVGLCLHIGLYAGGITADAGLTPAKGRWIIRNQARYTNMSMVQNDNEMQMLMFPMMVAYGILPELMVMARLPIMHREMQMMSRDHDNTGFGDFFFLTKYRLFRRNTRTHTLGFAATLAVEAPTGADIFSSESLDGLLGFYSSIRMGPWAADVDASYFWTGVAGVYQNHIDPGDEISINLGVARQMAIGPMATLAWAPVGELNFNHSLGDNPDSGVKGESQTVVNSGIGSKLSSSWIIFEHLVQFSLWDNLEQGYRLNWGLLFGVRVLL